jgi:enoyl-CoA hydratase
MVEIELKGPGKNSLGTEMIESLLGRLAAAAGDPVLLTGNGDAFSAGLNLKEIAAQDAAATGPFLERLERLFSTLYQYPGPTVALVNGHAIAGGCVLALCCDYRVAIDEPKIRIGLNEVALGLRFPPRTLAICRRRVPAHFHEEAILSGALFDPHAARRVGLLDEVSANAATVAADVLTRLEKLPRAAYAATKRDLRGAAPADLCPDAEEKQRVDAMIATWSSDDLKRRLMAALGR